MFKKINLLTAVLLFRLVDFSQVEAGDAIRDLYRKIQEKSGIALGHANSAGNETLVRYRRPSKYAQLIKMKKKKEEARKSKRSWCEFFCCSSRRKK